MASSYQVEQLTGTSFDLCLPRKLAKEPLEQWLEALASASTLQKEAEAFVAEKLSERKVSSSARSKQTDCYRFSCSFLFYRFGDILECFSVNLS